MMMHMNLFVVVAWVALIATVSVSGRDQGLLRGQQRNEERELTAASDSRWSSDGFLSQYNDPSPYGPGSNGWVGGLTNNNGVRGGVSGAYTGLAGGVNPAYTGLAGGVNGAYTGLAGYNDGYTTGGIRGGVNPNFDYREGPNPFSYANVGPYANGYGNGYGSGYGNNNDVNTNWVRLYGNVGPYANGYGYGNGYGNGYDNGYSAVNGYDNTYGEYGNINGGFVDDNGGYGYTYGDANNGGYAYNTGDSYSNGAGYVNNAFSGDGIGYYDNTAGAFSGNHGQGGRATGYGKVSGYGHGK